MEKYILKITLRYTLFNSWFLILSTICCFVIPFIDTPLDSRTHIIFIGMGILFTIIILYKILYYRLYHLELNSERLLISKGVFSKKTDFIELYRVKDYTAYQSFIMRILNIMQIKISSSDHTYPIFYIKGINYSNVIDILRRLVEEQRRIKGVREFD